MPTLRNNLAQANVAVADDGTVSLSLPVVYFQGTVADAQAKVDEINAAIDFFNTTSATTLANLQQSLADAQTLLDTVTANAPQITQQTAIPQ